MPLFLRHRSRVEQFSDLTHYVRTGDFIAALVKESQD